MLLSLWREYRSVCFLWPFFLFFSLFNGEVLAFGQETVTSLEEGKILQVSSSGESLVINLGKAEGYEDGERCKFYRKDLSAGVLDPEFHYVGEGELIKVSNRESYWLLSDVQDSKALQVGGSLSLVRQGRDPRRPFIVRRTLRVKGRSAPQEYWEVPQKGIPEDLIFEEEDFESDAELVETTPTKAQDFETEREAFYDDLGMEYDEDYDFERQKRALPPDEGAWDLIKELKRITSTELWRTAVRPSVEKYNNLKNGLKSLYGEVQGGDPSGRQRRSTMNMLGEQEYNRRRRRGLSPEIKERIDREGVRWSHDMSDDELRHYLIAMGVEEEFRHQRFALEERAGHEIILRYVSGLSSLTTEEDPSHRGNDYALGLSYEWHLKGTALNMENWALELGLERGISHFDVGGVNARIVEGSFRGLLNYYPLNPPSSLRKYMPYLGIGVKRGNGTLESFSLNENYRYQLLAIPAFQGGIKYRFRGGDAKDESTPFGLGLSVQLLYEAIRYNAQENVQEDIKTVLTANILKLSIGLNMYF